MKPCASIVEDLLLYSTFRQITRIDLLAGFRWGPNQITSAHRALHLLRHDRMTAWTICGICHLIAKFLHVCQIMQMRLTHILPAGLLEAFHLGRSVHGRISGRVHYMAVFSCSGQQ